MRYRLIFVRGRFLLLISILCLLYKYYYAPKRAENKIHIELKENQTYHVANDETGNKIERRKEMLPENEGSVKYGALGQLENRWQRISKIQLVKLYAGRLGNAMYQYAALYGIARKNNKTPLVHTENMKFKYIYITLEYPQIGDYIKTGLEFPHVIRPDCGKCEPSTSSKSIPCHVNAAMDEQFLHPGYFNEYREEIMKLLMFNDEVRSRCIARLDQTFKALGLNNKNCKVIGVHSRRGDKVTLSLNRYNYNERPASGDYIRRAITLLYKKALADNPQCVVTLVFGDDPKWSAANLPSDIPNIVVMDTDKTPGTGAQTDLCMLSGCHYLILTGGTYTFWAGYLSEGDVIIQENNSPSDRLKEWTILPACTQNLTNHQLNIMPECWPFGLLQQAPDHSCGRKLCYEMPPRLRKSRKAS